MEKKNQPAYPRIYEFESKRENDFENEPGMSKRELVAAMALQGLLANPDYNCPSDPKKLPTTASFAKAAVHYADALLAELEKPQP